PDSVANRILNRRHKPISLLETKDVQPFDSMIVSYAYEDVAIVRIRKRGYCSEKSFTISSISFELAFLAFTALQCLHDRCRSSPSHHELPAERGATHPVGHRCNDYECSHERCHDRPDVCNRSNGDRNQIADLVASHEVEPPVGGMNTASTIRTAREAPRKLPVPDTWYAGHRIENPPAIEPRIDSPSLDLDALLDRHTNAMGLLLEPGILLCISGCPICQPIGFLEIPDNNVN